MRGFRHVLVTLGGTPIERDAELVRAAAAAVDEHGELTLLCVAAIAAPSDPYNPLPGVTFEEQVVVDAGARERLEDASRHVPAEVAHDGKLAWGDPVQATLDELDAGRHDLVVAGHRQRSELSIALHGGSVVHRLLHRSPVPVLVLPWPAGHEDGDGGSRRTGLDLDLVVSRGAAP